MEAWRKLSQDQLVFSLPLYRKVEIDWNNMKEETIESEYDGYNHNEYVTYIPEEFEKLIDFINGNGDVYVYGTCPHCKKGMSFKIGYGMQLKLDSKILCSYVDEQIDAECYIPDAVDEMRKIVDEVSNTARFFERKFQCPICKSIYQVSYRLLFENDKLYLNKIAARWPAKAMAQFFFTL